MFRKYVIWFRRQHLLWKLHNHQGWLDEIVYSEQRLRAARQRTIDNIANTKVALAKLDGNAMLYGKAVVEVK